MLVCVQCSLLDLHTDCCCYSASVSWDTLVIVVLVVAVLVLHRQSDTSAGQ
jgi:hypothetical protein